MYSVGVCGVFLAILVIVASAEDKKPQSLFDDPALDARLSSLDIDPILANERILNNYVKCILNKGPCTPDGKLLKQLAPRAIATACRPCNQLQRSLVRKAGKYVHVTREKELDEILDIYDPKGKFRGDFYKFLLEDVDF